MLAFDTRVWQGLRRLQSALYAPVLFGFKYDALRHEVSWTHYRLLTRVDNETAHQWFMNEAAEQNWRHLFDRAACTAHNDFIDVTPKEIAL